MAAETVVSMVVERIGKLLIEEAQLIHGVRDQIQHIRDELWWMQSFLKDTRARQHEDNRLRTCVREIEEIAYDARDVLESFILRVESQRGGSILNVLKRYTCIVNECILRHKVGSKIQDIKARILYLTVRLQTYGVKFLSEGRESSSSFNSRQSQLRWSYSHVDEDYFVGLEDDVKILAAHLVDDDQGQVVAICGKGGVGKSTLARKVYNHEEVKHHFEAFAWVCISQNWQPRDVFQRILTKLIPEEKEQIVKLRNDELARRLFYVQLVKKCLIVLDDLWQKDTWDELEYAFPNMIRGKLLLTSRSKEVAIQVNPTAFIHELRTLREDECWELLKKKAFPIGDRPDPKEVEEKEKLGREMISHCRGLPLAVIVLGGILATKQNLTEWKSVHQSIHSYHRSGKGIGQHDDGVSNIFGLSYNDLPYQLKQCFLYLGKVQEDTEIKAETLYQLWMAESMVLSEDRREGETMMDVAEHYLGELAQRCMVEVQLKENEYGLNIRKFKSCRLHDLMRDLCLSKAREEDFFNTVDFQHENYSELVESSFSFANKTQRVIYFHDLYPSLLFFTMEEGDYSGMPSMVRSRLINFQRLKVLAIEGFCPTSLKSFDNLALLKAVGKLIHLRFLSLRNSKFFMFPSSINNLNHLQTLDLRGWFLFYLECSVNVLRKMRRLQHLYLPYYNGDMVHKLRLDSLSNLETLENYNPSWCDGKGLHKLVNLRKLTALLKDLQGVEQSIDYLRSSAAKHMTYSYLHIFGPLDFDSKKGHTILIKILSCDHLHQLAIFGGICKKLPGCDEVLNFSESLAILTLSHFSLEEDPMPTLEKLPNLQSLSLWEAFRGKTMVCSDKGFPRLKSLRLGWLDYFVNWRVEKGAMPMLSWLQLRYCKRLKTVPDGLRFITTLRELVIEDMDEEFKRRIQVVDGEEGQDFDIIRHVTSIKFSGFF